MQVKFYKLIQITGEKDVTFPPDHDDIFQSDKIIFLFNRFSAFVRFFNQPKYKRNGSRSDKYNYADGIG
jgi:hypothetical protein